jgi:hypothetical protein
VKRSLLSAAVALLFALASPVAARAASSGADRTVFISSAVEHAGDTVTLPLHRGTSHGQTVWFIVLDASNGNAADAFGVNRSQKLANARGTTAVQRVSLANGVIDFPKTVRFEQDRVPPVTFPPSGPFQPGAVGEDGYSPLVELPDGTILNAPHIANASGRADKVVSLDMIGRTVTYRETNGFARGNPVRYVSTDASDPLAATLEDVTLAPALDAAPFAGGDGTDSARASLAAFVNGQTGAANSQRQGLNSAVVDGLDPLNDLAWNPTQGRYSPLWGCAPGRMDTTCGRHRPEPPPGGVLRRRRPREARARHRARRHAVRPVRVHRRLPDRESGLSGLP